VFAVPNLSTRIARQNVRIDGGLFLLCATNNEAAEIEVLGELGRRETA
jgi:hypothetical protein